MIKIKNLSIKIKLTLVIITVSLVALIVGFSILTYLNLSILKKDLVFQSSLIARLCVENSEFALVFEDKKVINENLASLNAIPSIISAEIYDSDGKFFASFKNKPASFGNLIINGGRSEFKNDYLLIYEPFNNSEGKNIGCFYMKVSQEQLKASVNNYIFWLALIILFVFVIIIILARYFQNIISRPILKLAEIAQQITATHNYSLRIEKKSNDEIGILYEGFNKMLEEIVQNESTLIQAQNELRDSKELFATFMEMLPAAAYIKTADSSFSYINKYLTEIYTDKNLNEKNTDNNQHNKGKYLSIIHDKDALNSIQHFEEYIIDLNNNKRYFESWKFPIYRNFKPTMIGGISIDITDRKLAEKQVNFYVKELERNNKELEEFNYVASHDLREPLRTITSYCELLEGDIGESVNEIVKEDIRFITDATTRMNTLIQDLLQLSRAGRIEFEEKSIDLNKLFKTVLQDLELKIKETNSRIIIGQMPLIKGDMTQLGRVFQNLLTNAIKFRSDKNPEINIEATEINNSVEISVRDNGIGIENQYYEQIFSAFKRLHSRGKYEGTGIGLAICKKIIERHGGKIEIESEPGKGSTFKVFLRKG